MSRVLEELKAEAKRAESARPFMRGEVGALDAEQRAIDRRLNSLRVTDTEEDVTALVLRKLVLPYLIQIAEKQAVVAAAEAESRSRQSTAERDAASRAQASIAADRARLAELDEQIAADRMRPLTETEQQQQQAASRAGNGAVWYADWCAGQRGGMLQERVQIVERLKARGVAVE